MQRETFRTYLLRTHRGRETGKPLTTKAASDCIARLGRIERGLAINADDADLSSTGVKALVESLRTRAAELHLSDAALRDSATTLRRYGEFKVSQRANS
jgi:hypothetical protein